MMADPKHLGARIGITSVLHTWGSAMTHHPHVHMIVPGGGISLDGTRWMPCRPGFFLPVRVLSRLFRRLFLERLVAAHQAGRLQFFGDHAALADAQSLRGLSWRRCAKPNGSSTPSARSAGPRRCSLICRATPTASPSPTAGLIALTQRASPSSARTIGSKVPTATRLMTLATDEFIRRFLIHVLPKRLPPHPPLRPVRQRQPRRQHRAGARSCSPCRLARSVRNARSYSDRPSQTCSPRPLPLLRRPHGHHRDLRTRLPADAPSHTT